MSKRMEDCDPQCQSRFTGRCCGGCPVECYCRLEAERDAEESGSEFNIQQDDCYYADS